jgi:pimeloyl-ACP methyl ester carboxylesterase
MEQVSKNLNEVEIPTGTKTIRGNLQLPQNAHGIVLFAHGSGSSRFSPRNTYIADLLNKQSIATFLIDLLTPEEESVDDFTGQYRFDVNLLAQRLTDSAIWIKNNPETAKLSIGYFGASTGAAAALIAAAEHPEEVNAVVSRGGRPDLARENLARVQAPTLLIVGGDDEEVLELNREAFKMIRAEKQLEIVPGATHLFEEPGKLEEAAQLTVAWFKQYL